MTTHVKLNAVARYFAPPQKKPCNEPVVAHLNARAATTVVDRRRCGMWTVANGDTPLVVAARGEARYTGALPMAHNGVVSDRRNAVLASIRGAAAHVVAAPKRRGAVVTAADDWLRPCNAGSAKKLWRGGARPPAAARVGLPWSRGAACGECGSACTRCCSLCCCSP
jgi:hypothetical protein